MAISDQSCQFDLISTWSDDCGIFEYAYALLQERALGQGLSKVFARKLPEALCDHNTPPHNHAEVHRNWTEGVGQQRTLKEALLGSSSPALWVQYHPSFFEQATLEDLAQTLSQTHYRKRVLSVHNPQKLRGAPFLEAFTDVVVHNEQTAREIGDLAKAKLHIIPHFIYSRGEFERREKRSDFTIATVGFAARNKRVPLLIKAFSIAHAINPSMRCHLLTSPLPTHAAHFEISRIIGAIKGSNARSAIEADLGPKSMSDLLSAISGADLLCMPYEDTGESASGAARLGLAAGVPILRSRSSIFDDLPGGDIVLEDDTPHAIAEALLLLSQMPALLSEKRAEIDAVYSRQNAQETAARFAELLT